MPNTLAHFGFQGWLTRSTGIEVDPRWVLVGAVIPDVPWILQRGLTMWALPDPYALRLYSIAQASLFVTLLLCAALALLARTPARIFGLLAGQAVLHLLLDASETKWANGVHLLAPLSWELVNFGWFWPESPMVLILSLAGLGYAGWAVAAGQSPELRIGRVGAGRVIAAAGLLALYFALPLALRDPVEERNNHFVETLREPEGRAGRMLELDRVSVRVDSAGPTARTFAGEEIRLTGSRISATGMYSLRGRFSGPSTLAVTEHHRHHGHFRDFASYVGLTLLVLSLVAPGGLRLRRRRGMGIT